MPANHLILGLGGTGGKMIRALRKTIYQEFRNEAPGVNLSYLYIDSSTEMMGLDEPSWKILGTSVQLSRRNQLLIQDANLASRLENINNYPGIKPWIGSPDQWRDILGSIIGVTLGGQKRRLGRFLFSAKATEFQDQLRSLVKDLQSQGTTEVTFHVCTGLAGGTGSGTVIDVLAQIRDIYPDAKRYRIVLYALLPETYPNPSWDTGNYHANGFAALLELNALSVGAYQPFDVSGRKPGRLRVSDPFNGCYLFTNENENGLTVDVDGEMPGVVADFLYQKIVAVRDVSWPTLGRMENAENGDGTPERAPGSNIPERSKRFLAFGIKRLAFPEEEISEYLTYQFARQAALQLRYNTWSDSNGYTEESRNTDFHEFVRQPDLLFRWSLSDDHITLSTGILPEDANNKRWKPIPNEWQDVMPNFKSVVREQKREAWLDELAKLSEKRFDQDYRGLGVRNFYRTKLRAKKEHVREIRRRIETDLFTDWRNGVRSANDTSRLLAALLEFTNERLAGLDERITKAKDNEAAAADRVKANNQEWSHMGLLSKVAGKPDNLLAAQGDALLEQYIYRTRIEALVFAKQLLEELVVELSSLRSEVDRMASTIGEAIKRYNDRIAERIHDQNGTDLRAQLVRFYDPELVRKVGRLLVKDESEQKTQTARVRLALMERLGDHPDFAVFNQRIGIADFIDVLDKESAVNSQTAHNNLVSNPKERLLGVSIIKKLKERYGEGGQELRAFVSDLVTRAGNFLPLEPAEVHKVGPGIPTGTQTAVSRMTIIIPKAPEEAEFVAKLKRAFEDARGGETEFIDSDVRQNEIVLVSLTNLFPIRYVRQAAFLKTKYDARVSGSNSERAKLELHTEGDGTQWPRIFVPAQSEVQRDAIPTLLLARSLGLVQPTTNSQTGKPELLFMAKDESGFDTDPIFLGADLPTALSKLDFATADQIRTYVNRTLSSPEYMQEARRGELQKMVVSEVERIKTERGGNVQDEVYRRFLEGGRAAVATLKREA
ncbi:MAG: tubulin-like doman-containing protein [Acidobacteriaceae bacterium]|nr:tubulin-like doman-containing protein [Acidobacteriaceae bacterium]